MEKLKDLLRKNDFLFQTAKSIKIKSLGTKTYLKKQLKIDQESIKTRKYFANSEQVIQSYIQNIKQKKLHIGCQDYILADWLNIDIVAFDLRAAYMDATKRFPFTDSSFEFIFSEHMIEHLNFEDGLKMLNECYRILKPGGVLRIATPDLQFLINLYGEAKSSLQQDYIHFCNRFISFKGLTNDTMVINNFYTGWEHKFIYDKKTMEIILKQIGFQNIQWKNVGESTHRELQNIEKHGQQIPPQFNELETFVTEAIK